MGAGLAGLAAYLVVTSGWLGGVPGLLLLAAVLVLAPSHASLTHRLSINIAVFLGWTQVLWWVQWPGEPNHAGIAIGLGAAATVGAVLRGAMLRAAASRSDVLLMVAGPVAAAAAVSPWLVRGTSRAALEQMIPGVDNSAHVGMFLGLRLRGAVPEAVGPSPDGSSWGFDNYPKGFHSLVATLTEILVPRLDSGAQALPAYLQGEGLVVVLAVTLVVATVASLPGLRDRPLVAVPTLALTCTALLWEPGQQVFANGFAPFWLGAVAAGTALVLAIRPRPNLMEVAAVGGLVMLVCHCWLPLLVLAAPAGLLALVPHVGRGRSVRRHVGPLLVLGVAALGCLKAVLMLLTTVSVSFLVTEDGGYDSPALLPILVLLVAGCGVLVWVGPAPRAARMALVLSTTQRRLLLLTPVVGLIALAALFIAQVSESGTTKYYFVKLLIGYDLVLAILVPALTAVVIASLLPRGGRWQPKVGAAVALCLAAPFAFGVLSPADAKLFDADDPGTAAISPPYSRSGMAAGILAAANAEGDRGSSRTVYLALGDGNAGLLFYPEAWVHALRGSVTKQVLARMESMHLRVSTPTEAAALVTAMLEDEPDLTFLVPMESAAAVRAAVAPRWASQIVPLPTGS